MKGRGQKVSAFLMKICGEVGLLIGTEFGIGYFSSLATKTTKKKQLSILKQNYFILNSRY
jgi:hypothetical protein